MSTTAVSSSTSNTRGAHIPPSSSTGVMKIIQDLKTHVDECDWPAASESAQQLVGSGRAIILQNIKTSKNFNPLPMTETLLDTLASSQLQWEDDTKYHLARGARLFIELASMKAVTENLPVYHETLSSLRDQLDKLIEFARDDQVSLKYELTCCSEALKLMEQVDMKGYLTTLVAAVQNPGMGSIATLVQLIPDILKKRRQAWFTEALFLNWFSLPARTDRKLFAELRTTLNSHLDIVEIAQTGVEFLADVVWNGSPDLQQEALTGKPGLITLLNQQRPSRTLFNLLAKMWPVRYRAVQVLSTLTTHANPKIAQQATLALLDRRLQENNPHVKELLEALEKNPQISQAWKVQFEEQKAQIIDKNLEEEKTIEELEQKLQASESELKEATRLKKGSQQQIADQRREIEAERKYIEELRNENTAHKQNVEALHLQYKKGVNQLLDEIFVPARSTSEEPPAYLCCPISQELMTDPVVAADDRTYERANISKWLSNHDASPVTGAKLSSKELKPNRGIKDAIDDYNSHSSSRTSSTSSSSRSSSATAPAKADFSDLLIKLLDHEEVQKIAGLAKVLEKLFDELTRQKTEQLTPTQEVSYILTQKLLVEQKVSSFVSKKLLQIHVPAEPLPDTVVSSSSQASVVPQALSQPTAIASTLSKASPALPSIAFGAAEWKKYIGDVGFEPLLPPNIKEILSAPCPFWPGKKVQETHLLVLIPQTVNGQPLNLRRLGKLVQNPLQGHPTKFSVFDLGEYTDPDAPKSHWALLTRDIIEGSRNKTYKDQKALIASHSKKGKVSYEVPTILDATVCIFMEAIRTGTRLYPVDPYTYLRCQEEYNDKSPLVVGGFSRYGLNVSSLARGFSGRGVGGLRKFF